MSYGGCSRIFLEHPTEGPQKWPHTGRSPSPWDSQGSEAFGNYTVTESFWGLHACSRIPTGSKPNVVGENLPISDLPLCLKLSPSVTVPHWISVSCLLNKIWLQEDAIDKGSVYFTQFICRNPRTIEFWGEEKRETGSWGKPWHSFSPVSSHLFPFPEFSDQVGEDCQAETDLSSKLGQEVVPCWTICVLVVG